MQCCRLGMCLNCRFCVLYRVDIIYGCLRRFGVLRGEVSRFLCFGVLRVTFVGFVTLNCPFGLVV